MRFVPERDVEGFVLAGGASTRFGSDKALALHLGAPLLAHALRALEAEGLVSRVVAPEWSRYAPPGRAFVIAERPGLGPVEGLRVALEACAAPWALVLVADMPGVTGALLRRLLDAAGESSPPGAGPGSGGEGGPADPGPRVHCFSDETGRRHPFPGLYRREIAECLGSPGAPRSMHALLDAVAVNLLPAPDSSRDALRNVNRPEELPAAPPPRE